MEENFTNIDINEKRQRMNYHQYSIIQVCV
jgi:hypothetical protein